MVRVASPDFMQNLFNSCLPVFEVVAAGHVLHGRELEEDEAFRENVRFKNVVGSVASVFVYYVGFPEYRTEVL